MEKYRKCNICEHIYCYTDKDEKDSDREALTSGLAALGSVASAIGGTRYDMYEMGKISDSSASKVVNYKKCPKCGSIDTVLVTKRFAKYCNKNSEYDDMDLIKEAKKMLEEENYDDAFCFANMACLEYEYIDALIIKFLASYNIKSINQINKIEGDFSNNAHYLKVLEFDDCEEKEEFVNKCNLVFKEKEKIKIAEKNKEIEKLKDIGKKVEKIGVDKYDYNELLELKDKYEEYDLKNETIYNKMNKYINTIETKRKKSTKRLKLIVVIIILIVIISLIVKNRKEYNRISNEVTESLEQGRYSYAINTYLNSKFSEDKNIKKIIVNYFINKYKNKTLKSDSIITIKETVSCDAHKYINFNDDKVSVYYKCDPSLPDLEDKFKEDFNTDNATIESATHTIYIKVAFDTDTHYYGFQISSDVIKVIEKGTYTWSNKPYKYTYEIED